jgi:hypothetical protein
MRSFSFIGRAFFVSELVNFNWRERTNPAEGRDFIILSSYRQLARFLVEFKEEGIVV